MEDRRPDDTEQDDIKPFEAKRRGRAAEFFAGYMARREAGNKPENPETEEDDDDDSELSPSERRWKKLFKPLRSLMQRDKVEGSTLEKPQTNRADYTAPTLATVEAAPFSTTERPASTVDAAPLEDGSSIDLGRSVPGQTVEQTTQPFAEAAPTPTSIIEASALNTAPLSNPNLPAATEAAHQTSESPQNSEIPEAASRIPPESAVTTTPERTTLPTTSVERSTTITPEVSHTTVERNNNGATALVGLEYLARRRADKKVQKRVAANTGKQLKPLLAQANQQQGINQQLDSRIRQQSAEIRQVSDRRPLAEQAVIAPERLVTKQADRLKTQTERLKSQTDRLKEAERAQTVRILEQASQKDSERTITRAEKSVPLTEIYTRSNTPEARAASNNTEIINHEAPEIIIEKVAQAAEINAPIERSYERRGEIKDDPAFIAQAAGAAATHAQFQQSVTRLDAATRRTEAVNQSLMQQLKHMPPQYRQATASGFVAAVALLAVVLILYLA